MRFVHEEVPDAMDADVSRQERQLLDDLRNTCLRFTTNYSYTLHSHCIRKYNNNKQHNDNEHSRTFFRVLTEF